VNVFTPVKQLYNIHERCYLVDELTFITLAIMNE